ncbi:hypothetical protein KI387_012764, partial [Taxus chinensis]
AFLGRNIHININIISKGQVRVKFERNRIQLKSCCKIWRPFICRSRSWDVTTTINLVKQEFKDMAVTEQTSLCGEKEDSDAGYVFLLKNCVKSKSLRHGKSVHARIIKTVIDPHTYLQNNLIAMYAKLNNFADAHQVFDRMPQRNVVSWTALISGYAKFQCGDDALRIFVQMLTSGVKPNEFTFMSVLCLCDLKRGKQVQGHVIKTGSDSYVQVSNALVDMYAKCGVLQDACYVFDRMRKPDTIAWNTMIA